MVVDSTLPIQGAWVQSLVGDLLQATWCGQKKKMQKGYWFPKFYQLLYVSSNPKSLGLQAEQLSLRGSYGLRYGNVWWAETSRESGKSGLARKATNSGIGFAFLLNKLLPTPTFTDFLNAYSPLWYPTQHWNSFHSNRLTLWAHCFSHVLHHPNMSWSHFNNL